MTMALKANVIPCFCGITFVDKVKCLCVILMLTWYPHWCLLSLTLAIDLFPTHDAIFDDFRRMEIGECSYKVIVSPHCKDEG